MRVPNQAAQQHFLGEGAAGVAVITIAAADFDTGGVEGDELYITDIMVYSNGTATAGYLATTHNAVAGMPFGVVTYESLGGYRFSTPFKLKRAEAPHVFTLTWGGGAAATKLGLVVVPG